MTVLSYSLDMDFIQNPKTLKLYIFFENMAQNENLNFFSFTIMLKILANSIKCAIYGHNCPCLFF